MKKPFNDKIIGKFQNTGNNNKSAKKPKYSPDDLVQFNNHFRNQEGVIVCHHGVKNGINEYVVKVSHFEHVLKEFNIISKPLTRKVLIEKLSVYKKMFLRSYNSPYPESLYVQYAYYTLKGEFITIK
jgi:hypothetical protein